MNTSNHTPDDHTDENTTEPADRPEHLPCGRPLDQLLDQVATERGQHLDDHQQRCVHCQAALGEYARLWAPLHDLTAEHVTAPEGKIDQALARIRGAITDTDYATLHTPEGTTRVAARVVVVAARHTAQDVPGVRVALSKNLTGIDPQITAGVAGTTTAIQITLAADYGQPLHELGERVRDAVIARVRHLTDLEPVQVTVIIDDVLR